MHDFFPENLRNPARSRRAGLMRQFRSGQLDSILNLVLVLLLVMVLNLVCAAHHITHHSSAIHLRPFTRCVVHYYNDATRRDRTPLFTDFDIVKFQRIHF